MWHKLFKMQKETVREVMKGGQGSGNFDHPGRPGMVGGSGGGGYDTNGLNHFEMGAGTHNKEEAVKIDARAKGYDANARKVLESEYRKAMQNGGLELDRVVDPQYEKVTFEGPLHISDGAYGTGMYFAESGAQRMATGGGVTLNAVLPKDSKVADIGSLRKEMEREHDELLSSEKTLIQQYANKYTGGSTKEFVRRIDEHPEEKDKLVKIDKILNGPLKDAGWYAVNKGYDAVRIKGMSYVLVLNRGKLLVK